MSLICVTSPKGGVGKTSCAAGLAYGIQALGFQVLVVDFDSQNALRLHFGMALDDGHGFAARVLSDWSEMMLKAPGGIRLLPYGATNSRQRAIADQHFDMPGFVESRLLPLTREPGVVIIADLPPGYSPALRAVARLAHIRLTVLLADSASISLLPRVVEGDFYPPDTLPGSRHFFILNQVDQRRRLNAEITRFMDSRYGDDVLGYVHRDEAMSEANARQQSIFDHAPASAAAQDLQYCTNKLMTVLSEIKPMSGTPPLSGSVN